MSATSAVPTPASSPNKPRPKGKDAAATTTAATTSQPGPVPSMTAAIVGTRSPAKKPRASPSKRSKVGASMSASPIASTSQLTLQSNEPHAALDLAHILSTPRRGRRVGRIDMGWESPLADADRDGPTLSCPHTLPKASRVRKAFYDQDDLPETPSKRKASRAFAKDSTRPQRSLVDTHGWASAAMVSKVPLPDFSASPGFSPRPATTTPKGTGAPASDDRLDAEGLWSHFESPAAPTTPRLVPLEVAGLGRVAVHREFAGQIAEQAPYNNSSKPSTAIRRHGSFCSDYASGVSDASGTGSSLGTSTNPTSVGTPCPSGVSPSFSLCSQFPPSEPESPYKQANAKQVAAQKESQAQAQAHAHGSFSISPSSKAVSVIATASLLDNALYRPKLGGSHSVLQAGLPTLEWPDGPDGPWAAAGQHIDHLKQQRKEGVQKWLETDLDEESAAGTLEAAGSKHVHHPMVAKALLDRARKQGRQILAAVSASQTSPTKRSRGSKHKKKASRGGSNATPSRRKQEPLGTASSVTDTPSSRRSVATAASLARSDHSAIRGCKCGIEDESVVMVQCDHCRRWLHLPCVGIADIDELDDEWYCDECCERAINDHLSPASSLPATITSFADLSTPEGLQAAINMCEPVFALPSGTPIHRRGVALSSSIALAPSPPMLSVGQQVRPTSSSRRQVTGRSRAERVGWTMNEPGSPLARKSTTGSCAARHVAPETPSRSAAAAMHELAEVATTPSLLAGFSRSDWEPTRARAEGARPTTPSPRLAGLSTPSRWASGRKPSHAGGAFSIGLAEDDHPTAVDVFSTPSRLASGGAWGLAGYLGSQTPSRSLRGHQRMDSFSGGLSTPGRDLLAAGNFTAEPSTSHSVGGMSTLAFSSSSIDGGDDHHHSGPHFGDGGSYSLARAWQMHSPTSSTRAARSRQTSGFAGATPSSSSLLRTPELQPRRPSTSSLRGSRYDFDDPPTSSSPFPRTPTFDTGSPRYGGPSDRSAGRHHPPLGLGLPPPTSSSRLSKHSSGAAGPATTTALSSSYSANSVDLKDRVIGGGGGPPASTGKARQVSSEMPFGLGIGFDLDEVLDWS